MSSTELIVRMPCPLDYLAPGSRLRLRVIEGRVERRLHIPLDTRGIKVRRDQRPGRESGYIVTLATAPALSAAVLWRLTSQWSRDRRGKGWDYSGFASLDTPATFVLYGQPVGGVYDYQWSREAPGLSPVPAVVPSSRCDSHVFNLDLCVVAAHWPWVLMQK